MKAAANHESKTSVASRPIGRWQKSCLGLSRSMCCANVTAPLLMCYIIVPGKPMPRVASLPPVQAQDGLDGVGTQFAFVLVRNSRRTRPEVTGSGDLGQDARRAGRRASGAPRCASQAV